MGHSNLAVNRPDCHTYCKHAVPASMQLHVHAARVANDSCVQHAGIVAPLCCAHLVCFQGCLKACMTAAAAAADLILELAALLCVLLSTAVPVRACAHSPGTCI
jgi:hypothetical protein